MKVSRKGGVCRRYFPVRIFKRGLWTASNYLPEGQEDHRFDQNEFQKRAERLQQAMSAQVEEKERIERNSVGNVVNNSNPHIPVSQYTRLARHQIKDLKLKCGKGDMRPLKVTWKTLQAEWNRHGSSCFYVTPLAHWVTGLMVKTLSRKSPSFT